MKKLPEVNASFENLYRMLIAPIESKLMLAGIELRVFNHLSECKSADAVAEVIGSHPENTRLFLDGLDDRMEVMGGDYTTDPIGEGYDLVRASATLNFARDDMDSMITKIYDALNPGGVFITYSEGLTHERTKPDNPVLSMISLSLRGQDMYFNQGEIADSMLRVGFKSVRSRTLDTDWGPIDLDIGRK